MTEEDERCEGEDNTLHFNRLYGCHHVNIWYPITPRDFGIIEKITNLVVKSYPDNRVPRPLRLVLGTLSTALADYGIIGENNG